MCSRWVCSRGALRGFGGRWWSRFGGRKRLRDREEGCTPRRVACGRARGRVTFCDRGRPLGDVRRAEDGLLVRRAVRDALDCVWVRCRLTALYEVSERDSREECRRERGRWRSRRERLGRRRRMDVWKRGHPAGGSPPRDRVRCCFPRGLGFRLGPGRVMQDGAVVRQLAVHGIAVAVGWRGGRRGPRSARTRFSSERVVQSPCKVQVQVSRN